jgi:hypothetical protein
MAFMIVNAIVFQYSRLPHIFRVGRLVADIFAEARLRHRGAVQFLGAHGGDDSSVGWNAVSVAALDGGHDS